MKSWIKLNFKYKGKDYPFRFFSEEGDNILELHVEFHDKILNKYTKSQFIIKWENDSTLAFDIKGQTDLVIKTAITDAIFHKENIFS